MQQRTTFFWCVMCSAVLLAVAQEEAPAFYSRKTAGDLSPLGLSFEKTRVEHDSSGTSSSVNTDSIIGPLMQPIAKMFNYMAENRRTGDYIEEVHGHKKSRSMFDPEAIMEALGGNAERQTPAPSFMEKLFEPIVAPIKREMNKVKDVTPPNIFGVITTPAPPVEINSDGVRRAQPNAPTESKPIAGPFVSLYPPPKDISEYLKYPPALAAAPSFIPRKSEPGKLEDFFRSFAPPDPLKPLQLSDPFTVNPLIGLFTTAQPITLPPIPELKGIPVPRPISPFMHPNIFPLQDPFYNPLLPKRRSRLFDLLTGGTP